ncbi:MAG: hypothetical protein HZC01_04750 [Candidatus Kerfeldbacteria bacterium]|nr:hypothetical protein [Candidatus Kerfeldbacteria bacterium]
MRGKLLNVFLFLCAVVSVAIFARSYAVFELNDAKAQSGANYVVAYLETPDVTNSTGTTVSGQTPFTVRLAGTLAPQITSVTVSLVNSASVIQPMHCINATIDTEFRWHAFCDTLGFSNGIYRIQLTAMAGSTAIMLVKSTGLPAEFGPLTIQNQFTFTQPGSNVISGSVPVSVSLSGDVLNARVHIAQSGSGDILDLQKTSGEPMRSSVWQRSLDTATFVNGTYSIALSFQSLNGTFRERVVTQTVTISNQTACTALWTCGEWSACSTSGIRTRSCSDGCGTTTTESQPCSTNTESNSTTTKQTSLGISITQPQAQTTVSELLALRAQVSGSAQAVTFFYMIPLSTVEYRIANASQSTTDPTVWTQTWNTRDVPNGSYFIVARASDSAGQTALSSPIGVAVLNQTTDATPSNTSDSPQAPATDTYTQPDTDGDGADDATELTLGTDATTPDATTTTDSIIRQIFTSDPDEAQAALNQLVDLGRLTQAQAEQIRTRLDQTAFEQPTRSGVEAPEKLKVRAILSAKPESNRSQFIISGVGPADSYVTLYIYSNPIVVTTQTDAQGNFEYTLDSNLLDGKHEVYVTVNDETGKIIEKSAPLTFFVRSAQAISEEEYLRGDVDVVTSGSQQMAQYIRIVAIIILSLIAALGIGWLIRKKSKPLNP